MQPTSLWVYFNFQSNKKFFRDYFSNRPASPTRFLSSLSLSLSSSVASLRPVDLSLDLFQRPPTSPLSLVAPASHSFRYISLMELPYRSLSPSPFPSSFNPSILAPAISLQIPRTFYTTYLPLSATVTFVHVAILASGSFSPPFAPHRPFTLICSAKFSEKTTISATEMQPAGDDYFTIDNRGVWSSIL